MADTSRRSPGRLAGSGSPARRAPSTYRVRAASSAPTPPGVHLAGIRGGGSSAHGRPRGAAASLLRYVGTTVGVFVLALLLVTGVEVVVGHPLSGGAPGHTSLGDVVHPTTLTAGP